MHELAPWAEANLKRENIELGLYLLAIFTSIFIGFLKPNILRVSQETFCIFNSRISSPSKISYLFIIGLSLLIFILNFDPMINRALDLYHEGEMLTPGFFALGYDLSSPLIPYQDLWLQHGWFRNFYLPKLIFQFFGPTVGNLRYWTTVVDGITPMAIIFLAFRCFKYSYILTLIIALVYIGNNFWLSHRQLPQILSLIFVINSLSAISNKSVKYNLILAGIFSAIGVLVSLDFGLYAIFSNYFFFILSCLICRSQFNKKSEMMRSFRSFTIGLVVVFLPVVISLYYRGNIIKVVFASIYQQLKFQSAIWGLPYSTPASLTQFVTFPEPFLFYFSPIVCCVLLLFVVSNYSRVSVFQNNRGTIALLLLCHLVVSYRTFIGRSDFGHWIDSSGLLWILLFLSVDSLFELIKLRKFSNKSLVTYLAASSLTFIVVASKLTSPIDTLITKVNNFSFSKFSQMTSKIPDVQQVVLTSVADKIKSITKPGECIFDFSNQPAYYYLSNRPPASRFFVTAYIATKSDEEKLIFDLEKCENKLIIFKTGSTFDAIDGISNKDRAPSVSKYIKSNYRLVDSISGVEIYYRNV